MTHVVDPASPAVAAPAAWHALPEAAALARLRSIDSGLTASEAAVRLASHGPNALPTARGTPLWRRFVAQFDNLLIYVLLGSALISAILGHAVDTGVILGVVVINAIFGVLQEGKAERALDAIRAMIAPRASVLRDGRRVSVEAAAVVPGDVLLLEAGERVVADVRLLKARNLRIDESALTGESVPVDKDVQPVAEDAPIGDRHCLAFSGTLVRSGQGAGVVVATGPTSEIGRISALVGQVAPHETPLIRQMNIFARQLTIAILGFSVATLVFAVSVRGYSLADAFMVVVGMAVAAIPEGLPAVLTITLAIGVQRMAARGVIIRQLPAVEALGAVSTICTDKTGTLTRNEMVVTTAVAGDARYEIAGDGYAPAGAVRRDGRDQDAEADPCLIGLARTALLCNDAALLRAHGRWSFSGDPMEAALAALALKTGLDRDHERKTWPRLDEIPFDAAHRTMATLHRGHDGTVWLAVKGAPEAILAASRAEATAAGEAPVDHRRWHQAIDAMARDGLRVLALARRPLPSDQRNLTFGDVGDLTMLGLVGLMDPPRAEVPPAVAECRTAGITVKMITGDHAATASGIARQIGLDATREPLTGTVLADLDAAQLRRAVADTAVFARTSPEHKLRLVEAMQAAGAVVAMTGDGVNDAPALKQADIGVAMGAKGTEAAKEAAHIVLSDDNFASIVAAVREGRTVYDNVVKVIGWTLPTSFGVSLIIVAALLLGLTMPVTPVQTLWINMVTAICLGLALAFEPAEPDLMQRPPRRADEPLLSGFLLWRIVFVSMLFAVLALAMFDFAERRGLPHEAGRTLVVNTVVAMEIFYLFAVRFWRSASVTASGVIGTPALLIGIGATIVLQLAFTYLPLMQRLFGTQPLSLVDLAGTALVGAVLLLAVEAEKRLLRGWR